MPDRWVVNASPIIALGAIGRVRLLADLATDVVVPPAVAEEVRRGGDAASRAIQQGTSFRFPIAVEALPTVVMWGLGRGETAVISFALGDRSYKALLAAVPRPSTSRAGGRWGSYCSQSSAV